MCNFYQHWQKFCIIDFSDTSDFYFSNLFIFVKWFNKKVLQVFDLFAAVLFSQTQFFKPFQLMFLFLKHGNTEMLKMVTKRTPH